MASIRRAACLFLAVLLFSFAPMVSYASAVSAVYTAGSYAFKLILDACGVDMSVSAITSLLGSWDTLEEYQDMGAQGRLGAFSQYLYDLSVNAEIEEVRAKARADIESLHNLVHSAWGTTLSGVKSLITTLKNWFMSLVGYGTDTLDYTFDIDVPSYEWTLEEYCTTTKYPVPYTKVGVVAMYVESSDYEFVMTSYGASPWAGVSYIRNWYKPVDMEIVGCYNPENGVIYFYKVDSAADSGYSDYAMFYHYAYVNEDGTLKYSVQTSDYGNMSFVGCGSQYVGSLPFPVFASMEALESYCKTGVIRDVFEAGKVTVKADAVNADVQAAPLKSIPDIITLPASADAAAIQAGAVSDAIMDGEALKAALGQAGLAIDWGLDIPQETETPTDEDTADKETLGKLSDIIAAIEAIPANIAAYFGLNQDPDDDDVADLSLPKVIMSKFPFCIPFDIAHLVEKLSQEKEAPKLEIPIEFHYLDFDYQETFTVDFADWQGAVTVLRVMLDLAFVAGLMVVTRELIRG